MACRRASAALFGRARALAFGASGASASASSSSSSSRLAPLARAFSSTVPPTSAVPPPPTPPPPPPSGGGGGFGFAALALAGAAGLYYANENGLLPIASSSSVDYGAVRKAIADAMDSNADYDGIGSYGPVLVRLAWHCAGTYDKNTGTGGSDGATMRFAPESNHGANAGLKVARDLLEPIKKKFPGITYADLYTLAGAVAIEEMGGPTIPWKPGRRDAASGAECPPDGRLPDASKDAKHIRDVFGRMGFDDREMVALIGAHALGKCHTDRSGYDGPWTYSPTSWSNAYFTELKNPDGWRRRKWNGPTQYENKNQDLMMLPADMALLWDKGFKKYVDEFAADADAFDKAFAAAFGKLLELGVKRAAPAA